VSQLGRSMASALGANDVLVEAICLAHDLGHPPFGHSGEVSLDALMKDYGGFDHNKQSFRIVTKLEERYPDFPGLNLSWEVREGIVKHETEYDVADASEFNPELRGHLEAQISNVADELAYTAHDLDDGLRSGMITPRMLEGFGLWQMVVESIAWSGEQLTDLDRHKLIRRMIGLEIGNVVASTAERIQSAKVNSALDLQKLDHNVIGFSKDMTLHNRELKDFLYANLYRHHRVVRMAVKAETILTQLFDAYHKNPEMLPGHFQKLIEKRGLERTICDYLAGMTDRYAIDEHDKLFNPHVRP
jgi:dGTPase